MSTRKYPRAGHWALCCAMFSVQPRHDSVVIFNCTCFVLSQDYFQSALRLLLLACSQGKFSELAVNDCGKNFATRSFQIAKVQRCHEEVLAP